MITGILHFPKCGVCIPPGPDSLSGESTIYRTTTDQLLSSAVRREQKETDEGNNKRASPEVQYTMQKRE